MRATLLVLLLVGCAHTTTTTTSTASGPNTTKSVASAPASSTVTSDAGAVHARVARVDRSAGAGTMATVTFQNDGSTACAVTRFALSYKLGAVATETSSCPVDNLLVPASGSAVARCLIKSKTKVGDEPGLVANDTAVSDIVAACH